MTHAPREALRAYATGEADITNRLLVEAHLALCPTCPPLVAEYREAGPGLPDATVSDEIRTPSFERVWAAVERVARKGASPAAAVLPPSLLGALPDPAGWRWVMAAPQQVRFALLVRDADTGHALYLCYLPPRSRFRHRHLGREENVILSGGFQIGTVHVEKGDWVIGARNTEHSPTTGPDEDCWCLARLEAPGVRFPR
jgi:putative transcriptional regulator